MATGGQQECLLPLWRKWMMRTCGQGKSHQKLSTTGCKEGKSHRGAEDSKLESVQGLATVTLTPCCPLTAPYAEHWASAQLTVASWLGSVWLLWVYLDLEKRAIYSVTNMPGHVCKGTHGSPGSKSWWDIARGSLVPENQGQAHSSATLQGPP